MAELVGIWGVPHLPFYYAAAAKPRAEWEPQTVAMHERGERMREHLEAAAPDTLLVVGSDHFHFLFMDLMPPFLIGRMESFDLVFANEVREFGMPRAIVDGDPELAEQLVRASYAHGVDVTLSREIKLDHAVALPLWFVDPDQRLPIVPLLTNNATPPVPPAERMYEVGRRLRDIIRDASADKRVAVITSGHFSTDVGGPHQFEPTPVDPDWDELVTRALGDGDREMLLASCTAERLADAGNVAAQFLNFVLAAGLAEAAGLACTWAEAMARPGSNQPWFLWQRADQR